MDLCRSEESARSEIVFDIEFAVGCRVAVGFDGLRLVLEKKLRGHRARTEVNREAVHRRSLFLSVVGPLDEFVFRKSIGTAVDVACKWRLVFSLARVAIERVEVDADVVGRFLGGEPSTAVR